MSRVPENKRVLVIDDNRAIHEDFRKVLTAPKTARTIKPEPKARDAYEAHYRRYASIYPAIKEIYR